MGGRMVNRLLDKGHTVTGYNRTRSKAQLLIDRGMKWADSPRAVCAAADVTFAMVANSAALAEVSTPKTSRGVIRRVGFRTGQHRRRARDLRPRRDHFDARRAAPTRPAFARSRSEVAWSRTCGFR